MPNPNVKRLTHGQLVALRIEWRRLKADDDPRADGSLGRIYEDSHDGRISWAEDHLGITGLQAWDYLDIKEAAYLLDILWSKRSKLMGYLHALLLAKGIQSPGSPRSRTANASAATATSGSSRAGAWRNATAASCMRSASNSVPARPRTLACERQRAKPPPNRPCSPKCCREHSTNGGTTNDPR